MYYNADISAAEQIDADVSTAEQINADVSAAVQKATGKKRMSKTGQSNGNECARAGACASQK